jgi:hypothetical protein
MNFAFNDTVFVLHLHPRATTAPCHRGFRIRIRERLSMLRQAGLIPVGWSARLSEEYRKDF